jgi:uncharacterized protein YqgC (DUF456 family)
VTVVLLILGVVCLLAGLASVLLAALPGALLLWGGVWLIAWAGQFEEVGAPTLVATGLLAGLIIAADLAAAALGARAFGASRWAVLGSTLGLLAGLLLGPVGLVLGPVAGAAAFEFWKDPDLEQALRSGLGTFVGFVIGSVAKVVLVFLLLGALLIGLFF